MQDETLTETLSLTDEETPLPEGWRFVRLGDVCFTTSGGTPTRGVKEYYGGEISWVKSGELKDGYIETIEETITELGLEQSSARLIPADTLLIALYGANVGKLGILKKEAAINQAICAIIPNETVFTKFLFYHLLTRRFELINMSFGGAQPNISQEIVKNLKIPLPPTIEEQRRIASVLDEQMKAVEEARRAVEEQLRAANLLPNAFLRSVFESEEAQNWQKRKLGEVCDIVAKLVDPKEEKYANLPHISSENIEGKTGRLLFARTAKEDRVTSGKYLFTRGEVLYSKIRPYLRKAFVTESDGVCSADIYPIQVKSDSLDARFLAMILLSDEFTNYADEQSRRARMPKLNREQLFSWHISLPNTVEEQREIMRKLNEQMQATESLKQSLTEKLEAVKKLPAALLRRAFAGEI